jgi:hypothetical protein
MESIYRYLGRVRKTRILSTGSALNRWNHERKGYGRIEYIHLFSVVLFGSFLSRQLGRKDFSTIHRGERVREGKDSEEGGGPRFGKLGADNICIQKEVMMKKPCGAGDPPPPQTTLFLY